MAMAEPSAPTRPAPATIATSEPRAPKAMTSAAAGFAVQLGAFANEANARKLVDQLNGKGYDAAVAHHKDRDGRDWYVVRAGGYASADEAESAARHMREAEQLPAVVVHLRARSQA
jgi:DedD protein